MTPMLTIGLPVYNGERYLEAAVESLLNQTFDDFRLVISDNASDDSTPDILAQFAKQDSRVEVLTSPVNRGSNWNFNAVAQGVTSPYFKWSAHDDIHDPQYLEQCLNVLTSEPDVVAAHSRTRFIDGEGEEIARTFGLNAFDDQRASRRLLDVILSHHDYTFDFSVIRTSIMTQLRPQTPGLYSDMVLLAELSLRGRMVQVPEHLFANRLHSHRSSAQHGGSRAAKFSIQSWYGDKDVRIINVPTWSALSQLWTSVTLSPVRGSERRRCYQQILFWAKLHWRGLAVETVPPAVQQTLLRGRA
jgi:glycosyltransferase involved in cell wall biosynthesis